MYSYQCKINLSSWSVKAMLSTGIFWIAAFNTLLICIHAGSFATCNKNRFACFKENGMYKCWKKHHIAYTSYRYIARLFLTPFVWHLVTDISVPNYFDHIILSRNLLRNSVIELLIYLRLFCGIRTTFPFGKWYVRVHINY